MLLRHVISKAIVLPFLSLYHARFISNRIVHILKTDHYNQVWKTNRERLTVSAPRHNYEGLLCRPPALDELVHCLPSSSWRFWLTTTSSADERTCMPLFRRCIYFNRKHEFERKQFKLMNSFIKIFEHLYPRGRHNRFMLQRRCFRQWLINIYIQRHWKWSWNRFDNKPGNLISLRVQKSVELHVTSMKIATSVLKLCPNMGRKDKFWFQQTRDNCELEMESFFLYSYTSFPTTRYFSNHRYVSYGVIH